MVSRTPEQADLTCTRKVALAGQGSRAGSGVELQRAERWGGAAGRGGGAEQQSKPLPSVLLPWFPLSMDCNL